MISKDELSKVSRMRNLSLKNTEKDYLQEMLLFVLYKEIGSDIIFKGGTAMYKIYGLNRFSEDLDFTLNCKKFDAQKIMKKCLYSLRFFGINGTIKEIKSFPREINIRLLFRGPLYDGSRDSLCFLSLNISLREIVQSFSNELLTTVYKDIPSFEVYIMSLKEMLAEKVRSLLIRNKPRDVYDIWFLLKKETKPDIKLINKKLKKYKLKYSFQLFSKKIVEKENFWATDMRGLLIGNLPNFSSIKKDILEKFKPMNNFQKRD